MVDGKPECGRELTGKERLPDLVRRAVARHRLFKSGSAVLVAVSGGSDSTAMLHALVELSGPMALRLGVAHLDHGLRGRDAVSDAEFVSSLAKNYHLPIHSEFVDTRLYAHRKRLSLEEAGRELRYRFLLRTAECHGYDRVAVGHHREDNAETVLMGLLRGSGAAGLGGIAAVRDDGIVRPMIDLSRDQIRDYLTTGGFAHVTDTTNFDVQHLRNRVRRDLLPRLTADFNPNIVDTLIRTGDILRREDQWLDELSRQKLKETLADRSRGMVALSLPRFNRLPEAARRRVIRLALAEVHGHLRRIGHAHVTAALQLAQKEADAGPLHLPSGIRVQRAEKRLEIFRSKGLADRQEKNLQPDQTFFYSYTMPEPGTLRISQTGEAIRLDPIDPETVPDLKTAPSETAFLDADCLQFPLTVRNFRPGDRFSPLGTQGTQKLKKFFCDQKTEPQRRRACPLLVSADRIVWVAGMRIDNAVRLTEKTTRVLKAQLVLA